MILHFNWYKTSICVYWKQRKVTVQKPISIVSYRLSFYEFKEKSLLFKLYIKLLDTNTHQSWNLKENILQHSRIKRNKKPHVDGEHKRIQHIFLLQQDVQLDILNYAEQIVISCFLWWEFFRQNKNPTVNLCISSPNYKQKYTFLPEWKASCGMGNRWCYWILSCSNSHLNQTT